MFCFTFDRYRCNLTIREQLLLYSLLARIIRGRPPNYHRYATSVMRNKSNGVRTIDAFSRVHVLLYHTFICSFVLLLLKSSDSHTFLFQTLIYRNFGQKWRFCSISTRLWRTDGQTNEPTDRHTLL